MKKIGLLFLSLLLCVGIASAQATTQKTRNAQFSELPALSQDFIKKYFAKLTIDHITVEGTKKAEVDFKDGTELEFGRDGYWKDIENDHGLTQDHLQMLPGQMLTSLKKDFSEYKIEKIEHRNTFYKVELQGKTGKEVEIRYDLNGQYLY